MCMVSNPEHIQQLAVIIQLDMIEMGTLMRIKYTKTTRPPEYSSRHSHYCSS